MPSPTQVVLRTPETICHILTFCTITSLLNYGQTCQHASKIVPQAAKVIVRAHLRLYFDKPAEIMTLLRETGAVITGDVALAIALSNQDYRPKRNPTLTISVPDSQGRRWREELISLGYRRVSTNGLTAMEALMDPSGEFSWL